MKASEISNTVRFKIGDIGRTTVTQYMMCDYLNTVIRIINNALCNISSSLVLQQVTLPLINGNTDLPSNFREPILIKGTQELISTAGDVNSYTFRIIGNKLYALGDTVTLEYKADFPLISTDGISFTPDDIPLPYGFFDLLAQSVKDLIGGTLQDEITARVKQDIVTLTARRDRTKNVRRLIF